MLLRRLGTILLVTNLAVVVAACGSGGASRSTSATSTVASKNRCSADSVSVKYTHETGLPAAVEKTRGELYEAATSCDFERLGAAALQNPSFRFSTGADQDPVAYWKRIDLQQHTMAHLEQLLAGPFVKRSAGGAIFVWGSASGSSTAIKADGTWSYFLSRA